MSKHELSDGVALLLDDADDHLVIDKKIIYSHRLGYAMVDRHQYVHRLVVEAKDGDVVDHRDGNKLNCTRANLRVCTHQQNLLNRGKTRANTSGFKGVSYCKETGRYRAKTKVDGKQVHLGRFDAAEDAARAYDAAARLLHGEFAKLNFPAPAEPAAA